MKRCGENPSNPEYSMCGFAFDAQDTENDVEQSVFANPGEWVTCEDCRNAIKLVKDNFTYQGKCKSK